MPYAPMMGQNPSRPKSQHYDPLLITGEFSEHLFKSFDKPIWPGLAVQSNEYVQFYLNLWVSCEHPDPLTYGVLLSNPTVNPSTFMPDCMLALLFTEQEVQQKFLEWHNHYKARFGDKLWYTDYFPGLTAGARVDGFAFPAGAYLFDEWMWIITHTYQPVFKVNGFWIFQNESEMLMFKLRGEE